MTVTIFCQHPNPDP